MAFTYLPTACPLAHQGSAREAWEDLKGGGLGGGRRGLSIHVFERYRNMILGTPGQGEGGDLGARGGGGDAWHDSYLRRCVSWTARCNR